MLRKTATDRAARQVSERWPALNADDLRAVAAAAAQATAAADALVWLEPKAAPASIPHHLGSTAAVVSPAPVAPAALKAAKAPLVVVEATPDSAAAQSFWPPLASPPTPAAHLAAPPVLKFKKKKL
jgi:hypothetical protein